MPKKERYTVEQVANALTESAGLRSVAARKLGCSPSTVLNYITRHSQLLEVEAEAVEANLDLRALPRGRGQQLLGGGSVAPPPKQQIPNKRGSFMSRNYQKSKNSSKKRSRFDCS